MSRPLVSVIMPAYGGAATIKDSLDSALAQTYSNYEIIVVDDASPDNTVEIVESYGDAVKLIRREKNSGICEVARSEGIAAAEGDYCAFLDQDDLWEPEKLEKQVAFMEAHPEMPLSHHYVKVIDGEGTFIEIRHDGAIPSSGPCAEAILKHCFITISSIMVRGKVWMEAGNPLDAVSPNTDIEYFFNILRKYPAGFGFVPEVLGSYRRWSQSISRLNWKWSPEDVNALERIYQEGYWEGLMPRGDARNIICHAYMTNAVYHQQMGWPGRSLHFIRHGIKHGPFKLAWYLVGAKAIIQGTVRRGFATS